MDSDDYFELSITCAGAGRVVSGAKQACPSGLSDRLDAERVAIIPTIRSGGQDFEGDLPFVYITLSEPDPDVAPLVHRAWSGRPGRREVAELDSGDLRLALTLRPPDGVQDAIVRIERTNAQTDVAIRMDTTQDDAPDIWTVQAPVPRGTTFLRVRVRGRNFGGAEGVAVYEDPEDASSERIGWTPPSTYGYTPWSQLYTVDLSAVETEEEEDDQDAATSMHPLVSGLIGDIAKSTGTDYNPGLQAPLLFLVGAFVAGAMAWWPLRVHKPGGLVAGMIAGTIVWTVLGVITESVHPLLAFAPLIVVGILGVLAFRSESA